MLTAAQTELTPRQRYLVQAFHLESDTFANVSAELDLAVNPSDPLFYLYFVEPDCEPDRSPLLEQLRKSSPALIGGESGSGKTMLRYVLEQTCRTRPESTLIVSPPIRDSEVLTLPIGSFQQVLCEAIATDLFVQVLDRHHLFEFNPDLINSLAIYWHVSIPWFERKLRSYLESVQQREMSAWWWPVWQRVAVQFTPDTVERREFLKHLLESAHPVPTQSESNPLQQIHSGMQLARHLGFNQLFLLLDMDKMAAVKIVLQEIAALQRINQVMQIVPKLFVPSTIYDTTLQALRSIFLSNAIVSGIILWRSPHKLVSLVAARLRAGKSWVRDFDTLASQEINDQLQNALVTSANGSPRRLLLLVNSLIEAHVHHSPDNPLLTTDDWKQMCDNWGYGDPKPGYLIGDLQRLTMPDWDHPIQRREFSAELNVERIYELQQAKVWLAGVWRVLTITGAPAVGKTWFVRSLEQSWRGEQLKTRWLDASLWLEFTNNVPRTGIGRSSIPRAGNSLFQPDPHLGQSSPASTGALSKLNAVAEHLAQTLAKEWTGSRGIIFIDGADEAEESSWRDIERVILEPFTRQPNLRFVIALRDDWRLTISGLRYNERRLSLGNLPGDSDPSISPQGREQIEKLLNQADPPLPIGAFENIANLLPGYTWSHPGINGFLFDAWRETGYANLPNNLLAAGLRALDIPNDKLSDVQQLLVKIVTTMPSDKAWTVEELARSLEVSISKAWIEIGKLQDLWLLETEGARHQVPRGVRDFVRAASSYSI